MFGQLGSSRPLFVFGWDREFKIFWLICLVSMCGLCVKGIFENVHGHCVQTPRHSLTYVMHQHKSRILTWIPQTYCKLFWTSTWKSVIDAKAENCSERHAPNKVTAFRTDMRRENHLASRIGWATSCGQMRAVSETLTKHDAVLLAPSNQECWEIWEKLSALPPCSSLRSHPGQFDLALPTQLGLWKNWLNFIGYAWICYINTVNLSLSKYVPKPTAFVGFCQPSTSLKGIFPRDQAKAKDSKSPNIHLLTRWQQLTTPTEITQTSVVSNWDLKMQPTQPTPCGCTTNCRTSLAIQYYLQNNESPNVASMNFSQVTQATKRVEYHNFRTDDHLATWRPCHFPLVGPSEVFWEVPFQW